MPGFEIFVVLLILCIIVSWVWRFIKNENSPVISTRARMVRRICNSHVSTDANGVTSTSESLYLLFELDTGSELKLPVGGRAYRRVPKDEWGTLTFQGTRFLRFTSVSGTVEK